MQPTFYDILGVAKNATTTEIKKAYRAKVLKCHPDKTSHLPKEARALAEQECKDINEAYEVLTDPDRRKAYDEGKAPSFYFDEPEEERIYKCRSTRFENSDNNNRVKLTGLSNTTFTVHQGDYNNQTYTVTLQIEKNSLNPMFDRLNQLLEALNNKAFKLNNENHIEVVNEKYVAVANEMNSMYYQLMAHINTLEGNLINHDEMLSILQTCQETIKNTQAKKVFSEHRGFARHCPILRELCVCLDVIINSFEYLDKKIGNMISGDQTPVVSNSQEYRYRLFQPQPTNTERHINKLQKDIDWYTQAIKEEYQAALPRSYN